MVSAHSTVQWLRRVTELITGKWKDLEICIVQITKSNDLVQETNTNCKYELDPGQFIWLVAQLVEKHYRLLFLLAIFQVSFSLSLPGYALFKAVPLKSERLKRLK